MTDLTLTNRALRQAKLDTIDSLDANNHIAAYCRENIQLMIDEGLSEHNWNFAKKRTTLHGLTGLEYNDWLYFFDLPDDMIQPIKYVPTGSDHKRIWLEESEYEIFENTEVADRASGRLATNEPYMDLLYTKRLTAVTLMPSYFADAVSYLFAYHLSNTFGGQDRADKAFMMWMQVKLPWAIAKDNKRRRHNVEGRKTLTQDDGYIHDPYGYSRDR